MKWFIKILEIGTILHIYSKIQGKSTINRRLILKLFLDVLFLKVLSFKYLYLISKSTRYICPKKALDWCCLASKSQEEETFFYIVLTYFKSTFAKNCNPNHNWFLQCTTKP